jgi:hypothetical protein
MLQAECICVLRERTSSLDRMHKSSPCCQGTRESVPLAMESGLFGLLVLEASRG